MSANEALLDAIRRARGATPRPLRARHWVEVRSDDLQLLVEAAVQSLADADDVRRASLVVRPVVDDDGTQVEVTAVVPEAPR